MNCSKCGSEEYCKDGIVKGRQRFKRKKCYYHYTVEQKSDVKTSDTKRLTFEMYLEGLGFRSIGRILKASYVAVFQWIKNWNFQNEMKQSKL